MKRILMVLVAVLFSFGLRASEFYAADGITNVANLINKTTTYAVSGFTAPVSWQNGTVPDWDDVIVVSKFDNVYSEGSYGKANTRYNDITIRDTGIMRFCGNRDHKFYGRITVEDGGVCKMDYGNNQGWANGVYFKESLVVRVLPGGKFWCNRNVSEEMTLNPSCVLAGGELIFAHPDLSTFTMGGKAKVTVWFKGRCALKGTALASDNVGAKDDASVFDLEAGSLKVTGTDDGGLWSENGGYLNFTPYSTAELLVPSSAASVDGVFEAYFAGAQPRVRYDGQALSDTDFGSLFAVTDEEDGFVRIALRPQTSDVILVDGRSAAPRAYDNQELKPLDYFRVVYPVTGATVAYSLDDGATWADAIPRVRNAGTHTIKVRVSAGGFADVITDFSQTVTPRDATAFAVSAPDANYTGNPIVPELTINDTDPFCGTLAVGTDYDVVCENNVNPGTATCTVNYKGNYRGSAQTTFKIVSPKRSGDIFVDPVAPEGGDGTDESPLNSLSDACKMADNGAYLRLAAGTYVLPVEAVFEKLENVTVEGPTTGAAVVRPASGVSMRHFRLASVTNALFRNVQFRDATLELDPLDATTAQGGSFRIADSVNVRFESCAFVSNVVQNTQTVTTSIDECGGAICAIETDIHLTDCIFEANGALATLSSRIGFGGALYLARADVNGDQNVLRLGLTATNCVIRGNCLQASGGGAQGAVYGKGWGLDFYNCLVAGNYAKGSQNLSAPVICTGYGQFQRYTQCTLADNDSRVCFFGGTTWDWTSRQATPILIRSVVCGHQDDFDDIGDYQPAGVLIDSVYTSGHAPVASATQCGLTYASSNYARVPAAELVWQEGQVIPGSAAAVRNAGWRPTGERDYSEWFVSETGSDVNGGTSVAPLRTLTEALRRAGNGDTIRLAAGRYTQTAGEVFPLVLKDRYGLTVVGAGLDKTFVDGEGATPEAYALDIAGSYGIRFKDLTITRMDPQTGAYGIPVVAKIANTGSVRFDAVGICSNRFTHANHKIESQKSLEGLFRLSNAGLVSFENCLVTSNVYQVFVARHGSFVPVTAFGVTAAQSSLAFRNCVIERNGADTSRLAGSDPFIYYAGQFVRSDSGSFRLMNCLVRKNGLIAGERRLDPTAYSAYFSVLENTGYGSLENVTFVDNDEGYVISGSYSQGKFGTGLHNSIVIHDYPVLSTTGGTAVNAYNTLFSRTVAEDATLGKFGNDTVADGCLFGADPQFKDAVRGDFTLQATSPCVDTGIVRNWMNADASVRDGQDLAGEARLVGFKKRSNKLPDMGCYERQRVSGMAIIVR